MNPPELDPEMEKYVDPSLVNESRQGRCSTSLRLRLKTIVKLVLGGTVLLTVLLQMRTFAFFGNGHFAHKLPATLPNDDTISSNEQQSVSPVFDPHEIVNDGLETNMGYHMGHQMDQSERPTLDLHHGLHHGPPHEPPHAGWFGAHYRHSGNGTCGKQLRVRAQELVSKSHIRENIEHYFTSGPHLAAQNLELVNWTRSAFNESGLDTRIDTYDIWLNYPISHRVALLNSDHSVNYELSLEEPPLPEDPTTGREDRIPTFHGYSASGNATGHLVYAHMGLRADYDRLADEGVSLQGKVVLVRYGGIFRGLKVKFAEEAGAAAVLIYSDPAEDGDVTEDNGNEAYPKGPARHPESVQRGSVQDLSHAPGDPTSPGFPSLPGDLKNRTDPKGIPSIPSIPISYTDALPLLKALNGHGPEFPEWKGALHGVKYNVGPSKLKVNVVNEQDYDFRPNHDVIAVIPGKSKQEIIIGNHRDSWIIGGADPNSGSAVLLEIARVFGKLVEEGWKPQRTIVFASWDGEEYGLLGSTEWGEQYAEHLQKNAVAYLNCDVAFSGPRFTASANPLLRPVIEKASRTVMLNDSLLSDYWGSDLNSRILPLGSGSDYTVFQDHLGIPSLDCGFEPSKDSPVYHYHSNYDSLHWMQNFGDTELIFHEAVAKFIALVALELSERDLIPFGVVDYAWSIRHNLKTLLGSYEGPASEEVGLLFNEVHEFSHAAKQFAHNAHSIHRELKRVKRHGGFWNHLKKLKLLYQERKINAKLQALDQYFLHEEGLDERPWFKHIVYAPGRYTGYAGQVFPAIAESLEDGDDMNLIKWVDITIKALQRAKDSLN